MSAHRRIALLAEPSFMGAGALAGLLAAGFEVSGLVSQRLSQTLSQARQAQARQAQARQAQARQAQARQAQARHAPRTRSALGFAPPWKRWNMEALVGAHRIPVIDANARNLRECLEALDPLDGVLCAATAIIVPGDVAEDRTVLNLHPSLLPHYRGAAPQLAMLLRGEAEVHGGVTLHKVDAGIDTGPILVQRALPRSGARDGLAWRLQMARASYAFARDSVADALESRLVPRAQDGAGSTFSARATPTALHPLMTVDEARLYIGTVSDMVPRLHFDLEGPGAGKRLVVGRVMEVVGPPTGEAARIDGDRLEVDVADGRIALRRRHRAVRVLHSIRRTARLTATPYTYSVSPLRGISDTL